MTDAYGALLARIEATPQAGFLFGLDAMRAAVTQEGLAPTSAHVTIIAGTNGKGTVASTLHAMCVGAGLKVGLFTSPHLVEYRERIRVQGVPVSEADFVRVATPIVDRWGKESGASPRPLSYFEMGALLALAVFKDAGCDVILLEVGLGGRLDATNVIDADQAVITSVSLDHMEYLGDTIASIAHEKAAVARPGRIAFVHENLGGYHELRDELASLGALVHVVHGDEDGLVENRARAANQALAAAAMRAIAERFERDPEPAIAWGLEHVVWPGRQERVAHRDRELWIDGAHNPESIAALKAWLESEGAGPMAGVVSLSGGRSVEQSLWPVRPWVKAWFVCAPDFARARDSESVGSELRALEEGMPDARPVYVFSSVAGAFRGSRSIGDALVFGSLYLVGEVYSELGYGRNRLPMILRA